MDQNLRSIPRSVTHVLGPGRTEGLRTGEAAGLRKGVALFLFLVRRKGHRGQTDTHEQKEGGSVSVCQWATSVGQVGTSPSLDVFQGLPVLLGSEPAVNLHPLAWVDKLC